MNAAGRALVVTGKGGKSRNGKGTREVGVCNQWARWGACSRQGTEKVAHTATIKRTKDAAKVKRDLMDKEKEKERVEKMDTQEKEKAPGSHPQDILSAITAAATISKEIARNHTKPKGKAKEKVKAAGVSLLAGRQTIIRKEKERDQHPRLDARNANTGVKINAQKETHASLTIRRQTAAIGQSQKDATANVASSDTNRRRKDRQCRTQQLRRPEHLPKQRQNLRRQANQAKQNAKCKQAIEGSASPRCIAQGSVSKD